MIKVYRASVAPGNARPGDVEAGKTSLVVGTGDGSLSLEELQLEGKKRMGIAEFLRGYDMKTGDRLA